ncbi:NAD(P)-dependent oxidoreductase [Pontimicrobium aquaticum]|uniref:NAD(P)-dependent oxidoreductase n=1 Tax=Pontimicrobium aquaticum TaxID=2565367 RepID=UPI00145C67CC|nr:NAD(P)-dependent oxidoreductase [Pontimicrobium aquaticum]
MNKLKIYVSGIDKITKKASNILTEKFDIEYVYLDSQDDIHNALKNCDVFWFRLNHKLTRDILKDVNCKYILCAVTGLDHIDIEACNDFGIAVVSLKNESEFLKEVRATAEHTFGLMLALIRRTKLSFNHVESGLWNRNLFQGTELYKKKIGILGLGRLGAIVAKYADAFGMEVYFYDIKPKQTNSNFIFCNSAEELCSKVDILSIHLPYNKSTHFMINKKLLDNVSKPIYLVNTSRGGLVNEEDLLEKLASNKIAGYATDVVFGEPDIANNVLVNYASKNENVIITPHIGGYTFESIEKTELFIAKKLVDLINE